MPRILTLTMNPALDVSTATDHVEPTHKLRCAPPVMHPGGGGINVARVLHRLGGDTLAVYPCGGPAGEQLTRLLQAEGVPCQTLPMAGATRESFSAHKDATGREFRFVLPGPTLSDAEWQACLTACLSLRPDWLVLSGSLPPGVPEDLYGRIAEAARSQKAPTPLHVALDASGPALRAGLQPGVDVVKPSLRELRELTGHALDSDADIVVAARSLIEAGRCQIAAVTLGDAGAILVTAGQAWRAQALPVTVHSAIGAGDSFLAGLVLGLSRNETPEQAFRLAMATSAAALMRPGTALSDPEQVAALLPQVQVTALDAPRMAPQHGQT